MINKLKLKRFGFFLVSPHRHIHVPLFFWPYSLKKEQNLKTATGVLNKKECRTLIEFYLKNIKNSAKTLLVLYCN